MSEHLPKNRRKLLIVSDTSMRHTPEGLEVFEPTLREIENLSDLFETIEWVGYLERGKGKNNLRRPHKSNIKLIGLPGTGGKQFKDKFQILARIPFYFSFIISRIKQSTVVHTRGPSVPAFLAILISFFDKQRIYWHKYAGNWAQSSAPLFYRFQKMLLRKLRKKNVRITVNGDWGEPNPNILGFENPCITEPELNEAVGSAGAKNFSDKLRLCYAGALTPNKGVHQLVDAISMFNGNSNFKGLVMAGDGVERKELEKKAEHLNLHVEFRGYLNRKQLHEVYMSSHFIVLPSDSEGFPKVIAEGTAYGCIPIVTRVSCIDQYIKHGHNGFLLENNKPETILATLKEIFAGKYDLAEISRNTNRLAGLFTYSRYADRIEAEILDSASSN